MQKAIRLDVPKLTRRKKSLIELDRAMALTALTGIIIPELDSCKDNGELQKRTYHKIRKSCSLHSQVVLNLIRNAMAQKGKKLSMINSVSLDYNVPRAGSFIKKGNTWYAKLSIGGKRMPIPIAHNGSITHLESNLARGWKIKQVSLTSRYKLIVIIEKMKAKSESKNYLGVDVNANNLSVSVIDNGGKVLKQLYLGQGVWQKKARILQRKSILQSKASKGSCRARMSLRKLKHKMYNFSRNSCGELAKQVHSIAKEYDAEVVMERLDRFPTTKYHKKSNRKISLIPFRRLNERLIIQSVDNGNPLSYVDPYNTSRWCPNCGSVNNGHSDKNYAIYDCSCCGLEMNSDRKASYVIALKKVLERNRMFQHSKAGVPVNALFRRNEGVEKQCLTA